ncbi:MAG: hypothetical protein ACTSRZ_07235 [Promethearchaeota archaeon]
MTISLIILVIFVFWGVFNPSLIGSINNNSKDNINLSEQEQIGNQNNNPNSINHNINLPYSSSGVNPDDPNNILRINNASRFNITEFGGGKAKNSELAILSENFKVDIPLHWTCSFLKLDIPSIFEPLEFFSQYNLNGNFDDGLNSWSEVTPYSYSGDDSATYVKYEHESTNKYAKITYHVRDGELAPSDYRGFLENHYNEFNHASNEIELGDLFEPKTSTLPINNDFIKNPNYNLLTDPYGGKKWSSTVSGEWIASSDVLSTGIDITDGWLKGSPSVAWQTYFYIPFEADSITISLSWSVQNYGYEGNDEFSVRARIDNQYINGQNGLYQTYSEGTTEALEDDSISATSSHDFWVRYYNITNLVGPFGYRKGWHMLDFGCYMKSPNNGNDDVAVFWDKIVINATHDNWYSSAQLDFEYLMTNLAGGLPNTQEPLTFVLYIGPNSDPLDSANMRYVINTTRDLFYDSNWNNKKQISIRLPQHYKDQFTVDQLYFFIGLEKEAIYSPAVSYTESFYQSLSLDSFSLTMKFKIGTPEDVNLQGRFLPSGPWISFNSTNIFQLNRQDKVEINFTLTGYTNPYLKYGAFFQIKKFSEDSAIADVKVESFLSEFSQWEIKYNNSDSIIEINNNSLYNYELTAYRIVYEDLPAYDGDETNSSDWNITKVTPPLNPLTSYSINKTSIKPFLQNITLIIDFEQTSNIPSGIWTLNALQKNYLLNSSMRHEDFSNPDKYYHLEHANYTHSVRNCTGVTGNFNITLFNATEKTLNFSTKIFSATDGGNNATHGWIVWDEGVGLYRLITFWNDTTINNQTTRVGWFKDTFEMWRKTSYSIKSNPNGESVPIGTDALYQIEYNMSLGGSFGIENASIEAYVDSTGNLWGEDWGLDWRDLHNIVYQGNGLYDVYLKTGVDIGNYTISYLLSKPYYDPINRTASLWLNITGAISYFNITIISGVINVSNQLMLEANNIPQVNDTTNSIIQFLIKDNSTCQPVRDVLVNAKFNRTFNSMTAIEKYSLTFDPIDKGIYILTLNTTNLHATNQAGYVSPYSNYSLDIWITKEGYTSFSTNVSVQVKPINLYIETTPVLNTYQEESLEVTAALYSNISGLEPYILDNLQWTLSNASGGLLFGVMNRDISNFYSVAIDLPSSIWPGNYSLTINATGIDVWDTISNPLNFEINAKEQPQITFYLPDTIRVGSFYTVATQLTYPNGTGIINRNIILTINYSSTYSYNVFLTTGDEGKAFHDFSIPKYYEGNNLTITAYFGGESSLLSATSQIQKTILGKIPSYLTLLNVPSFVQTGYNATFSVQLSIEEEQSVDSKILYLFGFYDNQSEPFITRQLSTDSQGIASYTLPEIENGHNNITILFEFYGDTRVAFQSNQTTIVILPKWQTYINMQPIPDEVHLGQIIEINITLNSPNLTFSESYAGLPLEFQFNFGTIQQIFVYHADENGTIYFSYNIPNSGVNSLNLSITFSGTNKIAPNSTTIIRNILPKLTTNIITLTSLNQKLLQGSYFCGANLTDNQQNPLANMEVFFNLYDKENNLKYSISAITNEEGYASALMDLTDLPPAIYYFKIEFKGQTIYDASSSEPIEIEVTTPLLIFVDYIPYILAAIGIIIALSIIIKQTIIIPKQRRRTEALKTLHQKLADAENIIYILAMTSGGINVFEYSFTNIPIDGGLISGFLSAISSFGREIGKGVKKKLKDEKSSSELEEMSYKQFKILLYDLALVRIALVTFKTPSNTLKNKFKRFGLRFQEKFFDKLEHFESKTFETSPVLELIEEYLEVDLLYPHNINPIRIKGAIKSLDKKSPKRIILQAAQDVFGHTFYIREMINYLTERNIKEIEAFNAIIELRNEGLIFAINPRTQSLIQQFTPIISSLPEMARKTLLLISDGITSDKSLRKQLNLSKNQINDLNDALSVLKEIGLITDQNTLTELGEATITILKLLK